MTEKGRVSSGLTGRRVEEFIRFFEKYYIHPRKEQVREYEAAKTERGIEISYRQYVGAEKWIDVRIEGLDPLEVALTACDPSVEDVCDSVEQGIYFFVQSYRDQVKRTSLYFVFSGSREVPMVREETNRDRIIHAVFSDSMINFYLIFFFLGFFILAFIFGVYTPLVLVIIQLIFLFFSDRIILSMGEVRATANNPEVVLLSYRTSIEEYTQIMKKHGRVLPDMQRKLTEKRMVKGMEIDCESAEEVFKEYGIECTPENLSVKKVNLYGLVKEVADLYRLPAPKLTVVNTSLPNAAASGVSPSRSTVFATSGLMLELEDDEVKGVIGHEFSHVKNRDPLLLFGLMAAEYLGRVYVWNDIFFYVPFLFYFVFAFTLIYFIGKFFETRCDTDAANHLGQPRALASALRKIGTRRLMQETRTGFRVREWLGWDPHPPLYFRIARLERQEGVVRHPFLTAVKDCVWGFIDSF